MKKNLLKSICLSALMVVLCSQAANAQKTVELDFRQTEVCDAYLKANPKDTIVDGSVKLFMSNGKVVMVGKPNTNTSTAQPFTSKAVNVEKEKNGKVTVVTYEDGSVSDFTRTTTSQFSDADNLDVVTGNKKAIKIGHKDWDNQSRHNLYGGLSAGVDYMPKPHSWAPMVAIELGHESCHWLLGVQGELTLARYTQTADYSGSSYMTGALYALGGIKVWQDDLYKHYLAIIFSGGYAYNKTDKDNAEASSKNWGFGAKVGIRAKVALSSHWGLTGELGAVLQPWVEHTKEMEEQKLANVGPYAQVGIQCKF